MKGCGEGVENLYVDIKVPNLMTILTFSFLFQQTLQRLCSSPSSFVKW